MNRLSLRNNELKFKTSVYLPIILEELWYARIKRFNVGFCKKKEWLTMFCCHTTPKKKIRLNNQRENGAQGLELDNSKWELDTS